jgi:hypothetical protein
MVTDGLLDPNDTGKISETLVTVANVKRPMVTESNPMGQIRAGVLSLRGRCLWAMLRLSEVRPSEHVLEVRCLTGFRAIPRYVASELTPSNARAPSFDETLITWDYSIGAPGPNHLSIGTEILMMRMERVVTVQGYKSNWLLLRRSVDDLTAFERLGCLRLEEPVRDYPLEAVYIASNEMEVKIFQDNRCPCMQ